MPIIPVDQKFHTLDPLTPTQERGSALANAGREIYTDTVGGGGGGGVSSLDTLTGDITLVGAGDVTITNNGSDQITISAITGVASLEALTGALNIVGAGTVTVTDNGSDTITITGSGGGGSTQGEELSFNVRTTPFTPTTAGEHEGVVTEFGAQAVSSGKVYYHGASGWALTDSAAQSSSDGLLGVAVEGATTANEGLLNKGIVILDHTPAGATVGAPLYLDTSATGTAGTLTATAPVASGEVVRVAGYSIDGAQKVFFDPSKDWIELL
jgi:hypothetical protein